MLFTKQSDQKTLMQIMKGNMKNSNICCATFTSCWSFFSSCHAHNQQMNIIDSVVFDWIECDLLALALCI